MSATSAKWVVRPRANAQADFRLFCFPYAGAGISCFHAWKEYLPPAIEICLIQLPGRENRRMEAPQRRMKPLIETLASILQPELDRPFALFGHSMGALLSFELARELRRRHLPSPVHLFVSGSRAPQLPDPEPPIHRLPEAKFIERLKRLKGIPKEVLQDVELMQMFLPTLRADFELLETYFYLNEKPFTFPISAFGGLEDPKASQTELAAWCEQTNGDFSLQMLPGDHFFLHAASRLLVSAITEQIQQLLILK